MPQHNTTWDDEALRTTAHDLKNELASILALTEMIEVLASDESKKNISPQVQKIRERVKSASEKITKTFQQLREHA